MIESPAVFLADFGVVMAFGEKQGKVIFDDSLQSAEFSQFVGRSLMITFDPADFPGLDVGSQVQIQAKNYQVMGAPTGDLLHRCQLKVMP